eukprot:scaffold5793_cov67-Cylindrotheca_fusiformis.AAC.3
MISNCKTGDEEREQANLDHLHSRDDGGDTALRLWVILIEDLEQRQRKDMEKMTVGSLAGPKANPERSSDRLLKVFRS